MQLQSSIAGLLPHTWDHEHTADDEEPEFFPFEQWIRVLIQPKKLIDLATIVPFYITSNGNTSFIRVLRLLRLLRVLHIFKITKV